jgi:NAD(P)H-hydrate epimerase
MKVVTSQEMGEIDRRTIEEFGIPGQVLMERAGMAVASKIRELFVQRKTIVLAGGGNNGGDGLVVARELFHSGWHVKVLLFAKQNKLSPDCLSQLRSARQAGVPVEVRTGITGGDLHSALVVDALFGTGLNKEIKGNLAEVISSLNRSDSPVLSVDIPSGISADSGQVMGVAVKADYTVTFGLPKRGHFLYPGAERTGRLYIEHIGFPEELLTSDKLTVELLEKRYIAQLVPERPRYSHKGDYGHVLIVAGSKGKTGAAFMAAKACMRGGAGLVTLGVPESLGDIVQSRVTEEMTLLLPDAGDGTLSSKASSAILKFLAERADVLCIGPGMGVSDETMKLLPALITSSRAAMVIDADGINSIVDITLFGKAQAPVILTPHPGEMARLLNKKESLLRKGSRKSGVKELRNQIEEERIATALSFSQETGTYLLLKGVPTVLAEPGGSAYINPTGNPGMATGGTGDVLTGMVSSFMAQGMNPADGAILGMYMHGLAGDIAAGKKGEYSLIASDIIDSLPEAFKYLEDA